MGKSSGSGGQICPPCCVTPGTLGPWVGEWLSSFLPFHSTLNFLIEINGYFRALFEMGEFKRFPWRNLGGGGVQNLHLQIRILGITGSGVGQFFPLCLSCPPPPNLYFCHWKLLTDSVPMEEREAAWKQNSLHQSPRNKSILRWHFCTSTSHLP